VAPWSIVVLWHTVFTIGVIYEFTLEWYSAKQSTMHRPIARQHIWRIYTLCLSHATKTQTAVELGGWFCWPVFVTVTVEPAINKAICVSNSIISLKEPRSCYMSTYESGFLEGFRRWRGSILATQRNSDLHGSCSLPKHCGILDGSEQNSSKLQRTVFDIFRSHSAI